MPTMRAAVLTGYGGVERLELREVRRPVPGSGQLLVRVLAASKAPPHGNGCGSILRGLRRINKKFGT